MKRHHVSTTLATLAMLAVCGLFAACGDDNDDSNSTPAPTITSGRFNYTVVINKEATEWSDLTVTVTSSPGQTITQKLTAENGRKADETSEWEQMYLGTLLKSLSGQRSNYYVYTIAVNLPQFPNTVSVQYQWNVKSGQELDADAKLPVTIGAGYGVETNTGKYTLFSSSATSATVEAGNAAAYLNSRAQSMSQRYTLTAEGNSLTVN